MILLKNIIILIFLALISVESKNLNIETKEISSKKWWEHANFYQLYPRSFKDSNSDGIGDLKGMIDKLDHLKDLGITATWLSPIFASPQRDLGYDVSDFYKIDESYGTMTDFDNLITRAHDLDIKIMLDYIPNHTSDNHQWFIDSVNRKNDKDDYYVWKNGKNGLGDDKNPPNNWISVFGGPAWTYRAERKQWYLHQFTKYQPDLNYRHAPVKKEMTDVIKYYLDKGVDGFRLDAINHMFEDERFLDEPKTGWGTEGTYDYLEHIYTKDQKETYTVVYEWREFLDKYTKDNNLTDDKILMTEAYASMEDTMRYYQSDDGKRKGAHMPFNFALIYDLTNDTNAKRIKSGIDNWIANMPIKHTPSWVIGSHDHSRVGSRFGTHRTELANVLLMTLPGTSITYYGEEIGMVDNNDFEIIVDNRDPNRTPMQWDNTTNAGFTEGAKKPWLPVNKNYKTVNLNSVKATTHSIFHQYKELTKLRSNPTLLHGDLHTKALTDNAIVFIRELWDHDTHVTVANIAGKNENLDLTIFPNLPNKLYVAFVTSNSKYEVGNVIDTNNVTLGKYDAVILRSHATSIAELSTGLFVLVLMKLLM